MEFVRGGEIVGNLGAVSPLRLALRATSPVSGRLMVASLPKVGNGVCAQTEIPALGHGIAVEVENYTISLKA